MIKLLCIQEGSMSVVKHLVNSSTQICELSLSFFLYRKELSGKPLSDPKSLCLQWKMKLMETFTESLAGERGKTVQCL